MNRPIKIDSDALASVSTDLSTYHDQSLGTLNTALAQIEQSIQQLADDVPNVCEHMRGEKATLLKRGTAILATVADLSDTLATTAARADTLHQGVVRGGNSIQ